MKQAHLSLIFLLVYLVCWSLLSAEQEQYDAVIKEKLRVEKALTEAIENTANRFADVIPASEAEKKQTLEQEFFNSFFIAIGAIDTEEDREYLRMHFPMLVFVEEDGAYFYYTQEQEKEGIAEFNSGWSEKIFFQYPGSSNETEKRRILVETLERRASDIVTNHNYIAEQYGFSYSFFVPRFLEDHEKKLGFPMLFVVFQGWPLNSAGNIVYENCLDAGLYMKRTKHYSVSKPKDILSLYCVYHDADSLCAKKNNIIAESISKEDAVCQYGAFPCETCIP